MSNLASTLQTYPDTALIAVMKEARSKSVTKSGKDISIGKDTVKYSWVNQIIINRNAKRLIVYSTPTNTSTEELDLDYHKFLTIRDLLGLMRIYPAHAVWCFATFGQFMNPVRYCKILPTTPYKTKKLRTTVNSKTLLLATANICLENIELVP